MLLVALNEAAERGELILVMDGMCRWHRRRDGVVVIREILVLPFRRRTGVGRRMLWQVSAANPGRPIEARCPVGYESNDWWKAMGFDLISTEDGINLWRLVPA